MSRIYKRTDRIAVKIDDIVLKLAPLSIDQKVEIQTAMVNGRKNGDIVQATKGVCLAIKYAVKRVEGITDGDGVPYNLEFDGENLSDACVDDLLNLELHRKLALVCASIVNGIPSEFSDERGVLLEGVEFVKAATPEKNV